MSAEFYGWCAVVLSIVIMVLSPPPTWALGVMGFLAGGISITAASKK